MPKLIQFENEQNGASVLVWDLADRGEGTEVYALERGIRAMVPRVPLGGREGAPLVENQTARISIAVAVEDSRGVKWWYAGAVRSMGSLNSALLRIEIRGLLEQGAPFANGEREYMLGSAESYEFSGVGVGIQVWP